ncbi:MAG: pyridoxal-dependent decarboxylase [Thermodesulfobacteriota bacterium]|nr:pyridoxal-dependent decarboxylase [Thermodesulfobacteriota bacterium]
MNSLRKDGIAPHTDITSSEQYLKKLFIMPESPDKFVEFGDHLVDMIHDFFKEKGGIHSSISMEKLGKIFNHTKMPREPMLIRDVLDEIKNNIITNSVKVANPYYIGHMTSAIPYFMILMEMITVSLNQNQVKIESAKASSFVEREFLCWMHRLVFQNTTDFYKKNIQNPHISMGTITSDGTIANLTALSLAMTKAFPAHGRHFLGIKEEGLARALEYYGYRRAIIMVSIRGHYSICKVATLLGIGAKGVVYIPVHPYTNKINIDKLRQNIEKIRKEDLNAGNASKIIALIGIAGTTETGNIDDLDALSGIAKEIGAHFHVDAAWGGSALLMQESEKRFRGIDKADSVSIDAHKLLYTPNTMGMCLFRDIRDSKNLHHTSNYIIRQGSVDQGRFTIEGSRPFSCLKPWAAIKIIGKDGYRIIFDHALRLQQCMVRLIDADPFLELLNTPELFIINYRFVPGDLGHRLNSLMRHPRKNSKKITRINSIINEINTDLHKAIREHDTSFVSRTRLESTRYAPRKVVVLRAITVNPNTEEYMLRTILKEHRAMGERIWHRLKWSKAVLKYI